MVTAAENERLARVGPGTAMGALMRRYWQPIAPSAMLNEDPVREITILGEELVLYRDGSGQLGLVGPQCAHRLVHLKLGIPEEHGLRCPYHGWCYDEKGQCIETPLESADSHLRDHIRIPSYPVEEMGGLVWAYLGPSPTPILPPWDFLVWPNAIRQIGITVIPCNWLQCQENQSDPLHTKYMHGEFFQYQLRKMAAFDDRAADPTMHTSYRFAKGRDFQDGVSTRLGPYGPLTIVKLSKAKGAPEDGETFQTNIFPITGRNGSGIRYFGNLRVPMDDTHTYHISYFVYFAGDDVEAPAQASIPYFDIPMRDESGNLILDAILSQDFAAWLTQGDIVDRTQEHLAGSDAGIVGFRAMLEEQMELVEAGKDPINVFRDRAEVGDCIQVKPYIGSSLWKPGMPRNSTDLFHKGYAVDAVERDGPLTNTLVADLMRRAEDLAESTTQSVTTA